MTFDEIEDCFPNGAVSLEDGWTGVTAQWLHDFAKNIESAANERASVLESDVKRLERAWSSCTTQAMENGASANRYRELYHAERSLSDKMEEALTALVPCTAAGADCIGPYNTAKHVLAEVAALRAKETT